jgi:hypothetical protein
MADESIVYTNLPEIGLQNQIGSDLLLLFKLSFMGILKQLAEYLYLRKKDPDEPRTQWMKYMHGMNRISLIMFIVAVLIIIFKLVILPLIRG